MDSTDYAKRRIGKNVTEQVANLLQQKKTAGKKPQFS